MKRVPNIQEYNQQNNFNICTKDALMDMVSVLLGYYPEASHKIMASDYDGAIRELEKMVEHIQMLQAPLREKAQEVRNRKYRGRGKVVEMRGKK